MSDKGPGSVPLSIGGFWISQLLVFAVALLTASTIESNSAPAYRIWLKRGCGLQPGRFPQLVQNRAGSAATTSSIFAASRL